MKKHRKIRTNEEFLEQTRKLDIAAIAMSSAAIILSVITLIIKVLLK